ncbi:MAG: class I SAM-dependent methyltransferase [Deltaproteobacteria bacterium]|nr:class I SAM-dependent methyltransferase [Deltaproteobacteria bacterium]
MLRRIKQLIFNKETKRMEVIKTQDELFTIPPMAHEPGSIGYMEKILIAQLIVMSRPKVLIETGTFKGQTAKFVSQFLTRNRYDGKLYAFDLPQMIEGALKREPFFSTAANVQFIKGSLPGTLLDHVGGNGLTVDFAIIDSEHTYKQVTAELETLHPFLRPGAYVFCHDYRETDPEYAGVVKGIDEFTAKMGYDKLPIWGADVWGAAVLRKPPLK